MRSCFELFSGGSFIFHFFHPVGELWHTPAGLPDVRHTAVIPTCAKPMAPMLHRTAGVLRLAKRRGGHCAVDSACSLCWTLELCLVARRGGWLV